MCFAKTMKILIFSLIIPLIPLNYQPTYLDQDIQDLCVKYEAEECIDRYLLMAFCEIESSGQRDVVSADGQYVGLMQLNKDYFNGDLTDAENNIAQGSAYLHQLNKEHKDIFKAISYYSGENGKIGYYSKKVIRRWQELEMEDIWNGRTDMRGICCEPLARKRDGT